jgi:Ca2+-transporting ATPase
MQTTSWHAETIGRVAEILESDLSRGLGAPEAAARLLRFGRNEIQKTQRDSPARIFLRQLKGLVIWVLIAAAIVSALLGDTFDGAIILAIVVLNAVIGFIQEHRAEQAVAALAQMTAPRARILRDGKPLVVAAAEVVPGDVLMLSEGDLVAADARLFEAAMLRANEAPLTGESLPVDKHVGEIPADTALADRSNMVFLGTSVLSGSGLALVVASGMATEVGRIAALLEHAGSGPTPLQRKLDAVGRRLLWICFAMVGAVFVLGLLRGVGGFEMFLGAVSLAVAAIPEGLPAVVTVALALGVQRMVRRNALVRRLPAVETLGCVQVICTDKTGTLTMGEMTVRRVITAESIFNVTGEGYSAAGAILADGAEVDARADPQLHELLLCGAACNDAHVDRRDGKFLVIGDPTEGALLIAASKGGISPDAIDAQMPRLAVLPFSSDRKRMTVVRRRDENPWAFVKGAPEVIIERCSRIRTQTGEREPDSADRAKMLEASALMANDALRVLAFAEKRLDTESGPELEADRIETGLTLLGLVGMQDPPRPEAQDAIRRCKTAGIKAVMITGDHPATARAIGRELGIVEHGGGLLVGSEIERMDDAALAAQVEAVSVYARVTAEYKLRIVRAWKSRGAVVAMTGDGVNDAPALKESAVGVAMGRSGTEVAKQAADIIITDDNFASIVAAVEEGRGIYDNISKTLSYLMGGNAGELAVMLVAALVGWPTPLLPIQLLWINLVTDGLPALALATEPVDPGVLSRPPRDPRSEIMDRGFFGLLALTGCLTASVALAAFAWEMHAGGNVMDARNAAFSALVIAELMRSFGARSNTRTVWELGLFSNLRLFAVVVLSFALQLAIHGFAVLEILFGIEPVTLAQCLWWIVLGLVPLMALEARKVILRKTRGSPD